MNKEREYLNRIMAENNYYRCENITNKEIIYLHNRIRHRYLELKQYNR